tara:strand:+ start:37 stop:261 length:225 start_codon:yes stop_codon:yes gene_type:complete
MNDSRLHFESDDELEDFNKRTNFHSDYDYVSFILKRADEHGLKQEVEETAQQYFKEKNMKIEDAYYHAYHDWIK